MYRMPRSPVGPFYHQSASLIRRRRWYRSMGRLIPNTIVFSHAAYAETWSSTNFGPSRVRHRLPRWSFQGRDKVTVTAGRIIRQCRRRSPVTSGSWPRPPRLNTATQISARNAELSWLKTLQILLLHRSSWPTRRASSLLISHWQYTTQTAKQPTW